MNWNWLPAFIAEKLKELEKQREEKYERPVLHVPQPTYPEYPPRDKKEEAPSRGPIIIDLNTSTYDIVEEEI